MRAPLFCAALLFSALASGQVSNPDQMPADFDAYVKRTMEVFKVPGLAVAVVKDGKVLLAKGYGVRKLGAPEPTDADTLFGIASNTKLFTATSLALLVDEGKIGWEDRVQKYLPDFALADPYVSHEMTIRDLLVHRSGLGLGAGDLLWWPPSTYTADEVIERLRYLPLATSFRSHYAYDNVLYLVAGKLIEKVSGMPWKAFVAERILKRIGMSHSTTTYGAALASGNVAATHAMVDDQLRIVPPFTNEVTGPAGGIMSSANDMAKWLNVQLSRGRTEGGNRLFEEARATDLWSPVTPIPVGSEVPPGHFGEIKPNFVGYALGTAARDYRGRRMLTHTGGLPGYVSWVSMFPDDRFGIAVLTNQESGEAFESIAYRLQDHFLQMKPVDWTKEFEAVRASSKAENAAKTAARKRNAASKPHLPLADYAGNYRDAWYGDVTIEKDGDRLVMRFSHTPALVGDLEHWQYDTFIVRWRDRSLRADAFVTFSLTPDGMVDEVKMAPASPDVDFSFDYADLRLKRVSGG